MGSDEAKPDTAAAKDSATVTSDSRDLSNVVQPPVNSNCVKGLITLDEFLAEQTKFDAIESEADVDAAWEKIAEHEDIYMELKEPVEAAKGDL